MVSQNTDTLGVYWVLIGSAMNNSLKTIMTSTSITFWNSYTASGCCWLIFLSSRLGSGLCWESEDLFFWSIFFGLWGSAASASSSVWSEAASNMEVTELRAERDQNELPSLSFLSNTTEAFFWSLFLSASSFVGKSKWWEGEAKCLMTDQEQGCQIEARHEQWIGLMCGVSSEPHSSEVWLSFKSLSVRVIIMGVKIIILMDVPH